MANMKYVELGFAVEATGFRAAPEGVCCSDCGWPISKLSTAVREGKKADGSLRYSHVICPSLRQRAEMRRAALVNA